MGWPKRNERLRVYLERKAKSYLLYDPVDKFGIGEVLIYNDPENPTLATTGISLSHIHTKCRRVSWDDMPEVWRNAFRGWLTDSPEDYRGLWRMEERPNG
jgi:hypothetical protein